MEGKIKKGLHPAVFLLLTPSRLYGTYVKHTFIDNARVVEEEGKNRHYSQIATR